MLYALEKNGTHFVVKGKFMEKAASEVSIAEKAIEDWIASSPNPIKYTW